jgi:hypothetical protein
VYIIARCSSLNTTTFSPLFSVPTNNNEEHQGEAHSPDGIARGDLVSSADTRRGKKPVPAFSVYVHVVHEESAERSVSSTGNRTCVENRFVYCATGTEIYISAG